jgi:hypothetical protein
MMHKLLYKKLLHGPRNLVEVGKNGRRFVLNVGCRLKKLRPLSKLDLHPKSSCLKKPWNSNKLSSLVMEGKRLLLYNKEFQRPKCGLLQKQDYFYLKPYGNRLCHELIPWSLVIVRCFDYYHYTNYVNLQFEMAKML